MSTGGSGRQEQSSLQQQAAQSQAAANTAITKAEAVDPLEQRRRDYVTRILDWRDGTNGPVDVKNFPDQTGMALYNDAKTVTDAGRVGRGYGTLADGANPTYSAALDKELASDRSLAASGRLENFVNSSLAGADAEAGNVASSDQAKEMAIAGMLNQNANSSQDRYMQYLTRPKPPSFLKSLALGALGQTGALFGGLGRGGGGGGGSAGGGPSSLSEWSI